MVHTSSNSLKIRNTMQIKKVACRFPNTNCSVASSLLQIKEVSRKFYNQKMDIKLVKQEVVFDTVICTYELKFDNSAYTKYMQTLSERKESSLPIRASLIFEMFPFCVLFQKDLTVTCMGIALQQVLPQMARKKITAFFELVKPLIEFKFENIESRTNNMFELATSEEIDKLGKTTDDSSEGRFTDEIDLEEVRERERERERELCRVFVMYFLKKYKKNTTVVLLYSLQIWSFL